MFYIFPRAIAPDVCEQIVKDCKKNVLKKASINGFDKSSRDDPGIRKTSGNFIKDKNNKINELVWGFLREANKKLFNSSSIMFFNLCWCMIIFLLISSNKYISIGKKTILSFCYRNRFF